MNVLIIGLGSIARKHITALREIYPNISLFAFRSALSSPEESGIKNVYELIEIKELSIDFIIISNPTFKHKETISDLIQFNLPLFIEKPVSNELGIDSLLSDIAEKKLITYIACNLRFLDCLKFAKGFIVDKKINEINVYCGSYLPEWRPGQNFREVYSANKNQGGGVHLDLIHEIDYVYWIFGKPLKAQRNGSSKSTLEIDACDYANYLLEYDRFNASIVLNYFRRDAKRTFEIVCEDGTLNVDLLKNEVCWEGIRLFKSEQLIKDTYKEQMLYFTKNVLLKKGIMNNINEAYEILKVCLTKELATK